jgi:hypothetical protein
LTANRTVEPGPSASSAPSFVVRDGPLWLARLPTWRAHGHAQVPDPCATRPLVRIQDRSTEDWYGSAFAGATKVRDDTQLADHVPGDLRGALEADATLDPRARAVTPFITPGESSIEWVIGTPESLSAEANLRAALSAGLTNPTFDAVISHGTRRYLMGSFETVETAPVFAGDTDDPVLCGDDGETVTVVNEFTAEVSFFELNVRGDEGGKDCGGGFGGREDDCTCPPDDGHGKHDDGHGGKHGGGKDDGKGRGGKGGGKPGGRR